MAIPGYNLFRCDRSARVGGGVALYSHDELPITNVQTYDDKYCQALICTCESQKLFICVVYRPPECPTLSFRSCLDFIDQYIAQGADGEYQLSLLGDFNLPIIGWSGGGQWRKMAKNGEKWRIMAMANSAFSFVKFAIFRQFLILEFHI